MRRTEWSGERGNCSCTCAFGRISGGGGVKPLGRALLLGLAALAAAVVALDLAQSVQAQGDEQSGRIVARRLDDGRTEFGWQPAGGERALPRARYFPAGADVGRWLNSSPVEVGGTEIGRINARLREDGRIEFAFTSTDGERILPPSRYFPVGARVGRWLRSTEIVVGAAAATGFVAISARAGYNCALRTSGEIECWGSDSVNYEGDFFTTGALDAPSGEFHAVSAGGEHACGLRENGEIECWGTPPFHDEGQANAPAGRFSAVSAGNTHTCGLREAGAIECWGGNWSGEADAPAGRFTAVSAGYIHTCGLRTNGAIECWGGNRFGQTDAPTGRFSAISASYSATCAIRASGEIECWGR